MKRTVWMWELFGFAITSFGGTLLHFLYDLLAESVLIAPFCGVNESTWEHMKLIFWPMLIFALFESFFFREYESFWCVKLRGILIGLGLIPLFFYSYNGIIGKSPDFVNIAIFFIAAAVAYIYQTKALKNPETVCPYPTLPKCILAVIAILFVIFTFNTPTLAIFKDPISGYYGIQ